MRKNKLALEGEHALRTLSKQAILTKYRKTLGISHSLNLGFSFKFAFSLSSKVDAL